MSSVMARALMLCAGTMLLALSESDNACGAAPGHVLSPRVEARAGEVPLRLRGGLKTVADKLYAKKNKPKREVRSSVRVHACILAGPHVARAR